MMPKIQMLSKTSKEHYGIRRHDFYTVTIPYKIAESLRLQGDTVLHITASEKTRTMRFHKKKLGESIPVKIRQKYIRTYRKQRYYSTRVTIPISLAKRLDLKKSEELDVECNSNTLIIKPLKKNTSETHNS